MLKKTTVSEAKDVSKFITRVQQPYQLISMEVLEGCVEGLRKRIRLVRDKDRRSKLKMIKSEMEALINSL